MPQRGEVDLRCRGGKGDAQDRPRLQRSKEGAALIGKSGSCRCKGIHLYVEMNSICVEQEGKSIIEKEKDPISGASKAEE